jgi:hypothetical protein
MKKIAVLFAAVLAATGATAQTPLSRVSVGLQAAYNFNDSNEPALGAHLLVALGAGLAFYPAAQGYFVQTGSLWRASAALRWAPRPTGVTPYVAVGPYWTKRSGAGASITESGVIGQFGAEGTLSRVRPFAELQLLTGGALSSEVVGGVRVAIGR